SRCKVPSLPHTKCTSNAFEIPERFQFPLRSQTVNDDQALLHAPTRLPFPILDAYSTCMYLRNTNRDVRFLVNLARKIQSVVKEQCNDELPSLHMEGAATLKTAAEVPDRFVYKYPDNRERDLRQFHKRIAHLFEEI